MKKFVAIFLGSDVAMQRFKDMEEGARKKKEAAGMEAWGKWMAEHKAAIVEGGGPLGKTKRVDAKGVSDTRNELGAYVVVQAESHDAAAKLFLNHPHFTIFPGESVEVMELLPIPTR